MQKLFLLYLADRDQYRKNFNNIINQVILSKIYLIKDHLLIYKYSYLFLV